jgi:hypothetical protein
MQQAYNSIEKVNLEAWALNGHYTAAIFNNF